MENDHPLKALNGKKVGHYQVRIEFKPLRFRHGWTHFSLFSLYLEDQTERTSAQESPDGEWIPAPVIGGIHSRGGRGVTGWIEVGEYHPVIRFQGMGAPSETLALSEDGID